MKIQDKIDRLIAEAKKPIPDKLDTINGQVINLNLKAQTDQRCILDKLQILNTVISVPVIELESVVDNMVNDITGRTVEITTQDVYDVANELGIQITYGIVDYVLLNFDEASKGDPLATWNIVVEQLIYNYKN